MPGSKRDRLALNAKLYLLEPGTHFPDNGHGAFYWSTLLIALSSGQFWLGPGQQVPIFTEKKFDRLVLMTPPTGFFQAAGALADFSIPVQAWAGGKDKITLPNQIEFFRDTLNKTVEVDIRIEKEAGHFTFMNTLPPKISDPHPDREKFLSKLASEIHQYFVN